MLQILVVILLDGLGGVNATFFDGFKFKRVVNRLELGVIDVLLKLYLVLQISRLLLLHLKFASHISQSL